MSESSVAVDSEAPPRPHSNRELRVATVQDVHRLREILADAFYDDPVFGWLIPDDTNRRARLSHYFAIELRHLALPRGRVWTTSDLTGAALTLPPGSWRVPTLTALRHGTVFGARLYRATRIGAGMEWRHMRKPHYYVRDVGVHPDMQGEGLGTRLLRPTLERCDREGMPAYIEASNERSAALYERLGFQHTSVLRVAGSPPLWLMIRQPQETPRREATT